MKNAKAVGLYCQKPGCSGMYLLVRTVYDALGGSPDGYSCPVCLGDMGEERPTAETQEADVEEARALLGGNDE